MLQLLKVSRLTGLPSSIVSKSTSLINEFVPVFQVYPYPGFFVVQTFGR